MKKSSRIAELVGSLRADAWRERTPFSEDVEATSRTLLASDATQDTRERAAAAWLQKWQPCLFGRVAARQGLVHYCFLTPEDLQGSDESIQRRLQAARRAWRAEALVGGKSAIIIWALSARLATAEPDAKVLELAKRLLTLYLVREVAVDEIELDDIFLRVPGQRDVLIRWPVGINYFSAHADGRWWHDHRIPGGIAFSLNSVGHLVKSGKLASGLAAMHESLGLEADDGDATPIDSLEKALLWAMRTINMAADAASGKATRLVPLRNLPDDPVCPVSLPPNLEGKDHCVYEGLYHTDISLPSEYFNPSVTCTRTEPLPLDFKYLFHRHIDNPDHETMGQGLPIAAPDTLAGAERAAKQRRGEETMISGDDARAILRELEVAD